MTAHNRRLPVFESVFVGLCPDCSKKLNYCTKKREVKRLKTKRRSKKRRFSSGEGGSRASEAEESVGEEEGAERSVESGKDLEGADDSPWTAQKPVEGKSRDEEMEEYLEDLLL